MSETTSFSSDRDEVIVKEQQFLDMVSNAYRHGLIFTFGVIPDEGAFIGVKSDFKAADEVSKSMVQITAGFVSFLKETENNNLLLMKDLHQALTRGLYVNDLIRNGLLSIQQTDMLDRIFNKEDK